MENKFCEIFKDLRLSKNIGQIQLAKDLGVSNGIISMWETGLREPTMSPLITIAKYFSVSIDYLVGLEK